MKIVYLFILIIGLNAIVCSQTINVMGYERKINVECIENWNESDIYEYIGSFEFIHFGHHIYKFSVLNGVFVVDESFESLSENEQSRLVDVKLNGNKISAKDSYGNDFNARFVKLKCDVDSEILKGFYGLLVNEELLYIKLGD